MDEIERLKIKLEKEIVDTAEKGKDFRKEMAAIDCRVNYAYGSYNSPKKYDKTTLEYLKQARDKLGALIERMSDDK